MLTNFLNNWILDKNVKFDFKKKDYVFPLFDSSLSFFKDDISNSHRELINHNLSSYYYTYWYDGEEM